MIMAAVRQRLEQLAQERADPRAVITRDDEWIITLPSGKIIRLGRADGGGLPQESVEFLWRLAAEYRIVYPPELRARPGGSVLRRPAGFIIG